MSGQAANDSARQCGERRDIGWVQIVRQRECWLSVPATGSLRDLRDRRGNAGADRPREVRRLPGTFFNGERASALDYAELTVSVPQIMFPARSISRRRRPAIRTSISLPSTGRISMGTRLSFRRSTSNWRWARRESACHRAVDCHQLGFGSHAVSAMHTPSVTRERMVLKRIVASDSAT